MSQASNDSPILKNKHLWLCPAKLNLFLHITGQRSDGYHNLQSVFQLLDYCDSLEIEVTDAKVSGTEISDTDSYSDNEQIVFDCNQKHLVSQNNLVVKAAQCLQNYAKEDRKKRGAKIYLNKKLPIGGGIGGGSSNCATALVALNHLWQLGLSLPKLAEIGLTLGADVPVFVMGNTAFAEGIGEKLTPREIPQNWYLVIHPDVHISTAEIFSNPLLTRNSKAITIRDLDSMALPKVGRNDIQKLVCETYPEVAKGLNWLKQFKPNARMTGTGSCIFATFDNDKEARKIASQCSWPCFVARGVNQSPLYTEYTNLNRLD